MQEKQLNFERNEEKKLLLKKTNKLSCIHQIKSFLENKGWLHLEEIRIKFQIYLNQLSSFKENLIRIKNQRSILRNETNCFKFI